MGAVAQNPQRDRRRQRALQLRQRIFDALNGLIDVVAGLLVNIDDDGAHAAEPCGLPGALDAIDGLAEIADTHRRTGAIRNDGIIEGRGIEDLVGGIKGEGLLRPVERPLRRVDRRGGERRADVFEADADRGGDGRVDLNADRRLLLAVVIDQADAGDPRNLRRQKVLDIFVDLRNREVGRRGGDRHQERVGRIDLFIGRRARQVLWQQPSGRADGALNVLGGAFDAAPEIELHLDLSHSQRACGTDRGYPGNEGQLAFERRGHRRRHGFGIGAGEVRADAYRRNVDLRHAGDRQREIGDEAQQSETDHHQGRRNRTNDEWRRDVHCVA